jgi:hypothetical protein
MTACAANSPPITTTPAASAKAAGLPIALIPFSFRTGWPEARAPAKPEGKPNVRGA